MGNNFPYLQSLQEPISLRISNGKKVVHPFQLVHQVPFPQQLGHCMVHLSPVLQDVECSSRTLTREKHVQHQTAMDGINAGEISFWSVANHLRTCLKHIRIAWDQSPFRLVKFPD